MHCLKSKVGWSAEHPETNASKEAAFGFNVAANVGVVGVADTSKATHFL